MPASLRPPVAERYRLISPLGEGGMGRVWLARDEVLHREVAVKEVVPPAGLDRQARDECSARSLREARAIARLSHPSVVRIYDVVTKEQWPWIVMEYVPARSLHQIINDDGPLSPAEVARIGLGIVGALRSAHRAGVLHRDVKPSNVLLSDDRVVLTDFGLATVKGEATVTAIGQILGSPAYIAPERARDGIASPASDLWSLGATLYAALEGRAPYQRSTAIATLTALVTEDYEPPLQAGPLRPLLTGLLARDPADRLTAPDAERMLRRAVGPSRPVAQAAHWRIPRARRKSPPIDPAVTSITPTPTPSDLPVVRPVPADPPPDVQSSVVQSLAAQSRAAQEWIQVADPVQALAEPIAAGSPPSEPPAARTALTDLAATRVVAAAPEQPATPQVTAIEPAVAEVADVEAATPATAEAAIAEAAVAESAPAEAVSVEPVSVEPVSVEPVSVEPVSVEPESTTVEPALAEATVVEPASAIVEPASAESATGQPATAEAATAGPGPAKPATAEPPRTVPPRAPRPARTRAPGTPLPPWLTKRRLLAGGAILLVLLVVGLLIGLTGGGSDRAAVGPVSATKPARSTAPTPSTSQPAVPPVDPSVAASPTGDAGATTGTGVVPPAGTTLPAGWHFYHDRTGFTVAVPDGWTISHSGTLVYFHDPHSSRLLGIDQTDEPKSDPVADWTSQKNYRVSHGDFPGYRQIKIAAVNYHLKAADWEFTYNSSAGPTHVINRGAVFGPHQAYGFFWSTPTAVWADNLANFAVITSTFQGNT